MTTIKDIINSPLLLALVCGGLLYITAFSVLYLIKARKRCLELGITNDEIKQIITVCKAYSSAVGAGEFVSEIFGDEADELRKRGGDGGEFGAGYQS